MSLSLLHFLFDHSLLNSLQVTLWRGKVFREHGLPATLIEHLIGTMLGAENITQLPGQQVLKAGMYSIVLHDGHLAMAHSEYDHNLIDTLLIYVWFYSDLSL